MAWKYIHDVFEGAFFFTVERYSSDHKYNDVLETAYQTELKKKALRFVKDMSLYLGMEYDGKHFEELWDLGYLPLKVKALPEGIETDPNIPHMTFINTVDGFAWLTLYLETIVSSLAWKTATAATIAKLYRRQAEEWVAKTDPTNMWLTDFMCHDFSARGLSGPYDMAAVALGHATSHKGSDSLMAILASRYFYGVPEDEVAINSVNASEHSCSCTKIFAEAEKYSQVEEQFNEATQQWEVVRYF
jgi:nicotinamide phosphoribosyltransferase